MSKKVVIQGREDDWYEKAIFLLKQEPPKGRMNLVSEANQIIGNYMKTKSVEHSSAHQNNHTVRSLWIDLFFYSSLILLVITLIVYLV